MKVKKKYNKFPQGRLDHLKNVEKCKKSQVSTKEGQMGGDFVMVLQLQYETVQDLVYENIRSGRKLRLTHY